MLRYRISRMIHLEPHAAETEGSIKGNWRGLATSHQKNPICLIKHGHRTLKFVRINTCFAFRNSACRRLKYFRHD